jgi:FtsP/CotA-like multicopper oxidase with cupredoxin domain
LCGSWDHPIHIHFEECQTLARDGKTRNVPVAERGQKDVWRLRPSGDVTITLQFRDFAGMFMEHCYNVRIEAFVSGTVSPSVNVADSLRAQ